MLPRRLALAERVLRARTGRVLLVVEHTQQLHNVGAILRTAESLGVQHVFDVTHPAAKRQGSGKGVSKGAHKWTTNRRFASVRECIDALRADGRTIWATSLGAGAWPLPVPGTAEAEPPPERLALVVGHELHGVSERMLEAADRHVYLPTSGFTQSLNVSVAAALVLQRVLDLCGPQGPGPLPAAEQAALRAAWFPHLASTDAAAALLRRGLAGEPALLPNLEEAPEGALELWRAAAARGTTAGVSDDLLGFSAGDSQSGKMSITDEERADWLRDRGSL